MRLSVFGFVVTALILAFALQASAQGTGTCVAGTPCKFAADAPLAAAEGVTVTRVYKDGAFAILATMSGPSITFTFTFGPADVGVRSMTLGVQNANPTQTMTAPLLITVTPPPAPTAPTNFRVVP